MRSEIRNAAAAISRQQRSEQEPSPDLCSAARVVRRFLEELRARSSGWKVLLRYAIGAVIGLLDVLLEECEP